MKTFDLKIEHKDSLGESIIINGEPVQPMKVDDAFFERMKVSAAILAPISEEQFSVSLLTDSLYESNYDGEELAKFACFFGHFMYATTPRYREQIRKMAIPLVMTHDSYTGVLEEYFDNIKKHLNNKKVEQANERAGIAALFFLGSLVTLIREMGESQQ